MSFQVIRFPELEYGTGLKKQETCVTALQKGKGRETLFLLQHPHVITLGRGRTAKNLLVNPDYLRQKGIGFYETGRGGDITYHGPGQLVGYPILKLRRGEKDVKKYVCKIEEVIIKTLEDFGIQSGRIPGLTGVWVGDEKIAAIGVRLSRWVTSHGFALNVNPDLTYFQLITPCGISDKGVTSMSKCLGREVRVEEVEPLLLGHFKDLFQRKIIEGENVH